MTAFHVGQFVRIMSTKSSGGGYSMKSMIGETHQIKELTGGSRWVRIGAFAWHDNDLQLVPDPNGKKEPIIFDEKNLYR